VRTQPRNGAYCSSRRDALHRGLRLGEGEGTNWYLRNTRNTRNATTLRHRATTMMMMYTKMSREEDSGCVSLRDLRVPSAQDAIRWQCNFPICFTELY